MSYVYQLRITTRVYQIFNEWWMKRKIKRTNINLKIILSLKICIQSFNENMNFFNKE